ncbi:MAG TPA: leucyl aminopeptidase [Acidimicrobiia bacterium]
MALSFSTVTKPAGEVAADLLAVPVGTGPTPGPGADAVDAALDGGLAQFMEEAGFEGKRGQTLAVPTFGRLRAGAVVLVGVGKIDELRADDLRAAGASVARAAKKARSVATTLLDLAGTTGELDAGEAAQAFAEGVVLGAYRFLKYKGEGEPSRIERVTVVGGGGARIKSTLERGAAVAGAVVWARDIVNEPAGAKSPAAFADAAKRLLRGRGVDVKVISGAELKDQKLGGVLGVGQGSDNPPRFVKLTYRPEGAKGTLALVGKGVVFDSGGLSIKTSSGMETMKTDMSGAAAVIAAMSVLRDAGVKTKVVGYVPMVENMPSGSAIRPGDVLRIRNGKTVEVLNTDAEGRLILADALSLASEDGPDAIVDVATLTGACMVALGDKMAGLMGNDTELVDDVRAAADRSGEPVWPLPLPKEYRKLLESEVADLRNIGTGSYGGALTAGLFLQEFVDGVPWAHLDIAGPARAASDDGYVAKGGTGFGVRTLVELASTFETRAKRARASKPAGKAAKKAKKAKQAAKKSKQAKKE